MKAYKKLLVGLFAAAGLLVACGGGSDSSEIENKQNGAAGTKQKVIAELGPRPQFLVSDMDDSPLKKELSACIGKPAYRTDFSIAHRGAPLLFPEHTRESYEAGITQGAGILECDVTFTKDQELVCRHSQCDLHTTTNILKTDLAKKCTVPPQVENGVLTNAKEIKCCASDLTLAEFKTLTGKMDAANKKASTIDGYMMATAPYRTDLYASRGTLMTHRESIDLFKAAGVKMTPELKSPQVKMPFNGFTQEQYAQKMIDEYKAAGVDAGHIWAQSFNYDDVKYWIAKEPAFGKQAVALDGRYSVKGFKYNDPKTWSPSMEQMAKDGVKYIAPPMWMLLDKPATGSRPVPSIYAKEAKKAGLNIIAWSLERSGPLAKGGGWYYQTTKDVINNDGDMMTTLDVLAQDVGIKGIFSDWPATVSFYASCKGMPASQ